MQNKAQSVNTSTFDMIDYKQKAWVQNRIEDQKINLYGSFVKMEGSIPAKYPI